MEFSIAMISSKQRCGFSSTAASASGLLQTDTAALSSNQQLDRFKSCDVFAVRPDLGAEIWLLGSSPGKISEVRIMY